MIQSKYFTVKEFDCKSLPGSGININGELVAMLDQLREKLGQPIRITSGFRTEEYNKELQRRGYKASDNSEHLHGYAVDIAVPNQEYEFLLIKYAIEVGFTRIGKGNGDFVHLDIGDRAGRKNANRIWGY